MEHNSQPAWKRGLKCGISLCVFLLDKVWRGLARVVGQAPQGRCVVLYYHSVPAPERQLFAHQLDVVMRHARIARRDEEGDLAPGENYALITFDDGFENFLTEALPELENRRIPATVFAIADGMNRKFGPDGYAEKLLSLEQMRSLPAELVTIGSHTLTHPMLTQVDEGQALHEIQESRTKLEATLNRSVREFSFPFGDFNQRLVQICREAGYDRVYTTLPEFAFEQRGEFVIGRVRVDPTDWALEFRLKLAGAYGWLPRIFAWKRKIVSSISWFKPGRPLRTTGPRSMVR